MIASLVEKMMGGDRSALARLFTLLERDPRSLSAIMSAVHRRSTVAYRIGVTGPPGAGKSTIIDELVRRTVSENPDASAAIRRVEADIAAEDGWQFNFLVKIRGVRGVSSVFPVFVADDGVVDLDVGGRLLTRSYEF
ncbi:MAG: hypothetical protein IIB11_04265, partial [Chloroflexi bacterium]|nr:hypothetical protein [Chloroflexota bacterium]